LPTDSGVSSTRIDLRSCTLGELFALQEAIDHSLCAVLKVSAVEATLAVENELARELSSGWKGAANSAVRKQVETLAKVKEIQRQHVDAFLEGLGTKLSKPLTDRQVDMVGRRIRRIYRDSKKIASDEAKAKFSFTQRDARAINAINQQQTFWVGNFYNEHLSKRIRAVAEEITLQRGFDSRQAGRALERALKREFSITPGGKTDIADHVPARYAGNTDLYFRGVASTAAHQARSIGKMFAYADAGITSYRLENPMDRRTGQVCQQMNGQVFSVQTGVNQAMAILGAESPEEVKEVAPWLTASQLETTLEGTKPGTPEATAALEEAGAVLPPFHFLCRTEPVILATPRVEPPAALPQVPPKAKPAPEGGPDPLGMLLRSKAVKSSSGEAIPMDGPSIENNDVRWRVERDVDGVDRLFVRFKVTAQEGDRIEREMLAAKAKRKRWRPHVQSKIDESGFVSKEAGERGGIAFEAFERKVGDVNVHIVRERGALMNFVEMRMPSADIRKGFEQWRRVAAELGISDPGALPSKTNARALMQARILTQWDRAGWKALQDLAKVTPQAVDEVFQSAVRRNPKLKEILEDMRPERTAKGHVAYRSKKQAEFLKQHVSHLYHDLSDPDVIQYIVGDAQKSGLLSSAQRFERGIFSEGMSTPRDFKTGGADSVFVRIAAKGDRRYSASARVIIDPDQLGRSDWYFFNFDNFGAAGPSEFGSRKLIPEVRNLAKSRGFGGGNEVMLQNGVPVEAIKQIQISNPDQRKRIIDKLRGKGIKEINGKPLEKVIVG
jgi:hypothetical protein